MVCEKFEFTEHLFCSEIDGVLLVDHLKQKVVLVKIYIFYEVLS